MQPFQCLYHVLISVGEWCGLLFPHCTDIGSVESYTFKEWSAVFTSTRPDTLPGGYV